MRTRTGTGVVIALFLAFSLLCSVSLVAQDKPLVTSANGKTADAGSVDCLQYAADGTTCVAGQYFRSDNVQPSATWYSTALGSTGYGPWKEGNGSASGCLSCHHGSISTVGRGGGYLVGGHKNILRKVVAGQTLLDDQGVALSTLSDHNSATLFYTFDQAAGTLTNQSTNVTIPAYYVLGWQAGSATNGYGQGMTYGSCARCHTTGYRPDAAGPEPTAVAGTYPTFTYTKLTDAQFGRLPVGTKSGDTTTTSSWSLTGIQCERCHKGDMQYDATSVNPNYGTAAAPLYTNGRINHLTNIFPPANTDPITGQIPGTDFYMSTTSQAAALRPQINTPYALLCIECHQAYSTWTSKTAGKPGQVHLIPLPGFESLAPKSDGVNFSSTKEATGQFSATFGCSVAGKTTYDDCVAANGTVTYVPGGMSHGAVATILNSPHGRVTGYVDLKTPGSADQSLTIKGGTLASGIQVNGGFNTHFVSKGMTPHSASAQTPGGVTNGVAGSCAGCHNIHSNMPDYFTPEVNATNVETPLKECTECHADHGKAMAHPTGPGTPYVDGNFGSQESCNICHFSKKTGTEYHFLRINADVTYNTFPDARTYYNNFGSGKFAPLNTYNSGETYKDASGATQPYPAVGLDVDIACGQCHTGGDSTKNPYGLKAYVGDGGVAPRPYSRAFLAAEAAGMHSTTPDTPTLSIPLPAFGGPTTIAISSNDASEGSKIAIFYTIDGTTPQVQVGADYVSYVPKAGTTTIACAGNPCNVAINTTTTLFAIAAGPKTYNFGVSAVTGGTYGVQVAPTPVIAPTGAALTYPATVSVKITEGASVPVYFTTDGSTPTASSTLYTAPIVVNKSQTIKAIAIGAGYGNSNVASATFTVKPPTPAWSNVAPAKFPGTYTGAVIATLTDADANASICYTTNGTTPVAPCNGTTVASGAQIPVGASMTIKAIAIDGTAVSSMTSGTYVIK